MTTTRTFCVLLALACASTARAQTTTAGGGSMPLGGKAFVNVNVGGQTQARTMTTDTSFPIYGQTATAETTVAVDGGPIFDLNLGYRFVQYFGVALGYASFTKTGTAQGAASIPSPVFFNSPASVTISSTDAKRSDRNIYLLAVGYVPVTDKIEVSGFVGPSAFRVQQDLFVPIDATSVPAGTQNLNTTIQSKSGTAKGVNVGVDVSYWATKQIGAGVFARYNGGTITLAGIDVKAGGSQLGAGIRVKF